MAPSQGLTLAYIPDTSIRGLEPLLRAYFDDIEYPGKMNLDIFEQVWAPMIRRDQAELIVAADDDAIRGLCGMTYFRDVFNGEMTATMVLLWVAPECRGQGIGAALLDRAEENAEARGCTSVVHGHPFTVQKDGGRALFEKRGYSAVELYFRKNLE
jgi:GNAT superfamily N-acetyltransferase